MTTSFIHAENVQRLFREFLENAPNKGTIEVVHMAVMDKPIRVRENIELSISRNTFCLVYLFADVRTFAVMM